MKLGIDFGTTHTVVALVDRGNYPVVSFEGVEHVPSVVAARDGDVLYGWDAAAVRGEPGWETLRSFKRLLDDAGPATEVPLGGRPRLVADLLTGFLSNLHRDLVARSNAGVAANEELEAAVSVPANAGNAQRFLTLDAYRRAGFAVAGLLNEPSAAGFEYVHRFRSTVTARREHVLVYDLGGGTFDASLLRLTDRGNEVLSSEGIRRLGGDDFDAAILELVLARAGLTALDGEVRAALLDEVRARKEALTPQSRRLLVDLGPAGRPPCALPVEEVYDAVLPLARRTLAGAEALLSRGFAGAGLEDLAGLYVVGGAGAFPLVARLLRDRFGERRVKRSPHPFAATAIGLALWLDRGSERALAERFSRTFGVFREAAAGGDVGFDPIFDKDTPLPAPGAAPLAQARRYRAAHNVGHFRFVECGRVVAGRPEGDVRPWEEILFPFDPELRRRADLGAVPVVRTVAEGPEVEERYACSAEGTIEVTVSDLTDGYSRTFRLVRFAA